MTGTRAPLSIVIVGGGFSGLYAAMHLGRDWADEYPELQVTLLDTEGVFTFKPLLPELITGAIGPQVTTIPLEELGRRYLFEFYKGKVKRFDASQREIETDTRTLVYDYAILAPGSDPEFYGSSALEAQGLPLNGLNDALAIRQAVIARFQQACQEQDPQRRKRLLRFVVAGGGPAGVEVASEIHLLIHRTLTKAFALDPVEAEVILVHGGAHILPGLPEQLVQRGEAVLRSRGIRLLLKTRVKGVEGERIVLQGAADQLQASTLIWSAGMRAARWLESLPVAKDRRGAVLVDEYLRIPEYPTVYVVGDAASVYNWKRRAPYPALAPVAIRQGVLAARNIMLELSGQPKEPFRFFKTGQLISLGAGEALGQVLGLAIKGRVGWWLYHMAYLLKLVGLRSKLALVRHRVRGMCFRSSVPMRERD